MQTRSYAKLNLRLDVAPPQADGYHPLISVMTELEFHDELTIEHRHTSGIKLTCSQPELEDVTTNLVAKALTLLSQTVGDVGGWNVHLEKRIPLQAGLGGGSSNAAQALRLGNECLGIPLTFDRLMQLGRQLGSDVPFFLVGKLALVAGTGEQVTPLQSTYNPYVVLAKPSVGLDTGDCYRRWDALGYPHEEKPSLMKAFASNDPIQIVAAIHNDLAIAAYQLSPAMADLEKQMQELGFDTILVCGSGSCLAGLTMKQEVAEKAEQSLRQYAIFVTQTKFRK